VLSAFWTYFALSDTEGCVGFFDLLLVQAEAQLEVGVLLARPLGFLLQEGLHPLLLLV
jgi:hypothetical protein